MAFDVCTHGVVDVVVDVVVVVVTVVILTGPTDMTIALSVPFHSTHTNQINGPG